MPVLAYHIVWTTYGTWLPGDPRGWLKKRTPWIQEPDPELERQARNGMVETEVFLTQPQRALVEQTVRDHCRIRQWVLQAVNARSNHIHVVVSADHDSDSVMNQLKAWCSRRLSDSAELKHAIAAKAGRRRWFTEGGDKKSIDEEEYLENAIQYVMEGL